MLTSLFRGGEYFCRIILIDFSVAFPVSNEKKKLPICNFATLLFSSRDHYFQVDNTKLVLLCMK